MGQDYEEAGSAVKIDENALDKECIRLPGDYLKWAHRTADAKSRVDELKARLDSVQAFLAKEIRSSPEEFELSKVTDTVVNATILLQPRYQKLLEKLNQARHEFEMCQAVVWALEHKKRALTLMVDLHGMGYFSSPRLSKAGKEAVEQMTKEASRRPYARRADE